MAALSNGGEGAFWIEKGELGESVRVGHDDGDNVLWGASR